MIDLGLWASEQYAIPAVINLDDLDDMQDHLPTQ
jgi:endogenous inhibitor of DNA gyrase (YacG/DUF329 family)